MSEVGEENPPEPREDATAKRNLKWFLIGTAVLGASLPAAIWYLSRPLPQPRITAYTQINHDGREKSLGGTDGSRIYFTQSSPNEAGSYFLAKPHAPISGRRRPMRSRIILCTML